MDGICVEVMTDLATYFSDDWAPTTLYAASGRLIPFNSNSPTGSTFYGVLDRHQHTGADRSICPGLASSQSRKATLETVPMAA